MGMLDIIRQQDEERAAQRGQRKSAPASNIEAHARQHALPGNPYAGGLVRVQREIADMSAARRVFVQELARDVAPGIEDELSAALEALQLAQINLTAAEQALERHERITPEQGNVSAWARRRAELQGELEAYARLLEQATARAGQARTRHQAALHGQWQQRMAAATRALEQAREQGQRENTEAQAALVRVQADSQQRMAAAQAALNQIRASEPPQ